MKKQAVIGPNALEGLKAFLPSTMKAIAPTGSKFKDFFMGMKSPFSNVRDGLTMGRRSQKMTQAKLKEAVNAVTGKDISLNGDLMSSMRDPALRALTRGTGANRAGRYTAIGAPIAGLGTLPFMGGDEEKLGEALEAGTPNAEEAYEIGFQTKCNEYGLDPKIAQAALNQNPFGGLTAAFKSIGPLPVKAAKQQTTATPAYKAPAAPKAPKVESPANSVYASKAPWEANLPTPTVNVPPATTATT